MSLIEESWIVDGIPFQAQWRFSSKGKRRGPYLYGFAPRPGGLSKCVYCRKYEDAPPTKRDVEKVRRHIPRVHPERPSKGQGRAGELAEVAARKRCPLCSGVLRHGLMTFGEVTECTSCWARWHDEISQLAAEPERPKRRALPRTTSGARRRARRGAARLGARILDHYDELLLEAPAGHVWEASDTHQIVREFEDLSDPEDRRRTWCALVEDVEAGTRPCDVKDCEICEEERS